MTSAATPQDSAGAPADNGPLVGIVMGSDSDWPTVEPAAEVLAEFGIPMEIGVVSAHRTPERMLDYARGAHGKGLKVIIACAGGAAHLPGMIAAATPLPVIGIPRALGNLDGLDSLLSIVQMPAGVPTATVSIDGAKNAGLLAVRTLAVADDSLLEQMVKYQDNMREQVLEKDRALRSKLMGGE
ncbi:5-(carboxyamino)imidazole ribonucleotide mutase [Corynebacterium suicordis]